MRIYSLIQIIFLNILKSIYDYKNNYFRFLLIQIFIYVYSLIQIFINILNFFIIMKIVIFFKEINLIIQVNIQSIETHNQKC